MFCSQCGQKLPDTARFCVQCGTKVAGDDPVLIAAVDRENPVLITDAERQKAYEELAEIMLQGLETGQITVEHSQVISEFVLGHVDDIKTQAELNSFFSELAKRWPIFKRVTVSDQQSPGAESAAPAAMQKREEAASSDTAQLMAQLEQVDYAGSKGKVTDEIFQLALQLYATFQQPDNPAIRNIPQLRTKQITLEFYDKVQKFRRYLKRRWEDDRRNKQDAGYFMAKIKPKLIEDDYRVFAEGGGCSLVQFSKFIEALDMLNTPSMLLSCPSLLAYFDRMILEDIFCALFADQRDPRTDTKAFASVNAKFNSKNIQYLLDKYGK